MAYVIGLAGHLWLAVGGLLQIAVRSPHIRSVSLSKRHGLMCTAVVYMNSWQGQSLICHVQLLCRNTLHPSMCPLSESACLHAIAGFGEGSCASHIQRVESVPAVSTFSVCPHPASCLCHPTR